MVFNIIDQVRKSVPFVHNITNYVTANDCANILLACGASPIMADDIHEVEEITSLCNALVINIGTLNERTIEAMIAAGRKANELNHPVILDPVGIGASKLRYDTTFRLLKEVKFSVIRGNASEIKTIYLGYGKTQGVDANASDRISEDNLEQFISCARKLSETTKAVSVITGAIDIVADKSKAYIIHNGHPMMSKITGTGCMLTSVIGAMCAVNTTELLEAAAVGVSAMGLCGELAFDKISKNQEGTASLKVHLIDAMSKLDSMTLKTGARYQKKIY